jgi:hypothetical protein
MTASDDELVEYLGHDIAEALRGWELANGLEIRIPARRWSERGYTEASLHSLVVQDGAEVRHVILKTIPPRSDGAAGAEVGREPVRHRQARQVNEAFAGRHLVSQPFPALLTRERKVLMFQSFAADGGRCVTLNDLPGNQVADACGYVLGQLLAAWSDCKVSGPSKSVASLLTTEIQHVLYGSGTIAAWAPRAGLLDRTVPWIRLGGGDGRVLPNPLLPAFERLSFGDRPVDLIYGPVHGDLHVFNVLLPIGASGSPMVDGFQLIDLATFADAGPLTRDPVCLMLSAIASTFDAVAPDRDNDLIGAVLGRASDIRREPPFVVARAVRTAFGEAISARGAGLTRVWPLQFLLSVQAGALLFTSYERFSPRLRWWFVRLAAAAASAVAEQVGAGTAPASAPVVVQPFDAPASTGSSAGTAARNDAAAALDAATAARGDGLARRAAAEAEVSAELVAVNVFGARNPLLAAQALTRLSHRATRELGPLERLTIEVRHHLARWTRLSGDEQEAAELEQRNHMDAQEAFGDQDELTERCRRARWR